MVLEGTVSNVAAFGAFVDLGVHQDGLVHVSQLSHKFVNDAREVVKTGDIVKVKVLEVDAGAQAHQADDEARRRAARREGTGPRGDNAFRPAQRGERAPQRAGAATGGGAMAAAFEKLKARG